MLTIEPAHQLACEGNRRRGRRDELVRRVNQAVRSGRGLDFHDPWGNLIELNDRHEPIQ